jgi:hypothetical protein
MDSSLQAGTEADIAVYVHKQRTWCDKGVDTDTEADIAVYVHVHTQIVQAPQP